MGKSRITLNLEKLTSCFLFVYLQLDHKKKQFFVRPRIFSHVLKLFGIIIRVVQFFGELISKHLFGHFCSDPI